jgi:gliding-associated putative ABC transporter substrate-binding component GldG
MKKTGLVSSVGILMVVVILVLINLIANTTFTRLDLTEGKIFSLSKASKQVVAGLEEPLTVKVFASKNLSPQLNDVKRFVNDLLSGYQAYGKGNFRYEFIDPGTDEDLEKEAQNYRIPPFQENVWNKDKLELKKVYLGAVFLYGDKQQTIPTLQSTAGLEYNITSLIKKLSLQQEYTIGMLAGHGEPGQDLTGQLSSVLLSNYKVNEVKLDTDTPFEGIDALMIVGPEEKISMEDRVKIDQYIMNGGPVGWFYSPVKTDLQQARANDRMQSIDTWTSSYGFRINSDLVADINSSMINIQERRGFFTIQNTINYPFFPNVVTFNEDHVIVTNLDLISLFFPSSIDTSLAANKGITLTPLLYSGPQTMVQTGRYDINATKQVDVNQFTRQNIVLAAALEGPFKSYFAGGADFVADEDEPFEIPDGLLTEAPEGTRMFAIGNSNFIQDAYLSNPANIFLVLNVADWLVGDTDLIDLRSREISMRPLKDISEGQKAFWKYFNWFGPPLLAVIIGIVYMIVRKNRRYGES